MTKNAFFRYAYKQVKQIKNAVIVPKKRLQPCPLCQGGCRYRVSKPARYAYMIDVCLRCKQKRLLRSSLRFEPRFCSKCII